MSNADENVRLDDVLRALPLLDDVYLGMQAFNVEIVGDYLEQLEAELLQEYVVAERTPAASALFVSALSQMWVFATYELLRTWRQRARELLTWSQQLAAVEGPERDELLTRKRNEIEKRASEAADGDLRFRVFEQADTTGFAELLQSAWDRVELAFRAFEAVRMTLAKHEVPLQRGVYAAGPGYGRIDMTDGSIYRQIDLGDMEVAQYSRRDLADGLRGLARPNNRILPAPIKDQVRQMGRQGYGHTRVALTLEDGREYGGVHVAWATEVVGVEGHGAIPFDVSTITTARPDPRPEDALENEVGESPQPF